MAEKFSPLEKPDASPQPLLEAAGICKFYGTREVLHAVNLRIFPRELVTIVGPNGAGKSTLLACLMGLVRADRGHVTRAEGLRIGYVPQHFRPQPSMPLTVEGFLKLYGLRPDAAHQQLAAQLDVEAVMDAGLSQLSGGELRRVLLMRALLRHPQLLVLDEPTQGIDVIGQGEFYRLLKRLSESQGMAVLMVSHDLHVVMAATRRVICLNRHICCEGAPERVGGDPKFKALFGEELARQLALYPHEHHHTHPLHEEASLHRPATECHHG